MERWSGVFKVPLYPKSKSHYRIAASLCLTSSPKALSVPSANVLLFNGDRVEGTGNPVIERLSNIQTIADILVSKFDGCVNAWVVEASVFNGPFAIYKDFIPSVNQFGEPVSYSPIGFPASTSIVTLLANSLAEAKSVISGNRKVSFPANVSESGLHRPKTIILGFSKGGTVINQLVSELSSAEVELTGSPHHKNEHLMGKELPENKELDRIIPVSKESLLNSISQVHYVDVGLNSTGAYLTDRGVIQRVSKRLTQGAPGIRFVLHGTPRQWSDHRRVWIRNEKDKLVQMLESEVQRSGGKLQVRDRFYFADRPPDLQMHFQIIETMDVN